MLYLFKLKQGMSTITCSKNTCSYKILCSFEPRGNDGPFLEHRHCIKSSGGIYQAKKLELKE